MRNEFFLLLACLFVWLCFLCVSVLDMGEWEGVFGFPFPKIVTIPTSTNVSSTFCIVKVCTYI